MARNHPHFNKCIDCDYRARDVGQQQGLFNPGYPATELDGEVVFVSPAVTGANLQAGENAPTAAYTITGKSMKKLPKEKR